MSESNHPSTTEEAAEDAAVRAHQPEHGARNTRVIWLLLAATFVAFFNETIMSNALPDLVKDLHITIELAQWLSTAFMLTMAVVIPITGFLLQRFSTRQAFLLAIGLFSAGTLLAAVAPGFEVLLAARVIQASGTAIMMPLMMTTLMTVVAPADRGRFMGRVSIVMSVAPAVGPLIAGVILHSFPWRFMFIFVLPLAITMLVIGALKVENVTETRTARIDLTSVIISAFGFGGLVYGLTLIGGVVSGKEPGNTFALYLTLGIGVIGVAAFILRQLSLQRRDAALLDLRTFKSKNFAVSIGLMAVMMAALFGTIILVPIYLQQVLGLEPLEAGLIVLPGGLLMGLLGPVVGRLFDRFGPTPLLLPGSIVASGVLWSLTQVNEHTSPLLIMVAYLVMCGALAFMFTPLFTSALGSVEPRFYSHGSAIVGTLQQVAGAIGTALFITVLTAVSLSNVAKGTTPIAAQVAGIRSAFMVGAIISIIAIIGTLFVRKPADMDGNGESHNGGGDKGHESMTDTKSEYDVNQSPTGSGETISVGSR